MSLSVTAIIAAYNEGDVIGQVIGDLIAQGLSVYLIDHASTDDTADEAAAWLDRGLLAIERFPEESGFPEELAGCFPWERLLERKEQLARELDGDWFLNTDADELREGPFPGRTLPESIEDVDRLGYNAIDFAVLNFVPTHDDFRRGDDLRRSFVHFEPASAFDQVQIKCWKRTAEVDLHSTGGHEARFPGRWVFPIRFLDRHYPVRSQAHGERKVFRERRPRFLDEELQRGWHVQYDAVAAGQSFLRDPTQLVAYDPVLVRLRLLERHRGVEALAAELGEAANNSELAEQIEQARAQLESYETELDSARVNQKELAEQIERARAQLESYEVELDSARVNETELVEELERAPANGESWVPGEAEEPTYSVAAASNASLPSLVDVSVLRDPGMTFVRRALQERDVARAEAAELRGRTGALETARSALETRLGDLSASMSALEIEALVAQRNAELRRTRSENETLSRELRAAHREVHRHQRATADELAVIIGSKGYRLLARYRTLVERMAPEDTWRRRTYRRLARDVHPGFEASRTDPGIDLTPTADPLVSVVIPAHGRWDMTSACLRSLAVSGDRTPYEVIVVDDASPDATLTELQAVRGLRVLSTPTNLGFVGACNLGIAASTASYVALLNNDTQVVAGWLDALVETMEDDQSIGLVGAQLRFPDGSLQEAGGIVFDDGTAMNYGRGDEPQLPKYSFLRDVDYCSGAAILVRGDLLEQLGGLDEQYAPAYYEDVDLAFTVRSKGYRVVYQPRSVVIHYEGASHGTDTSSGEKRFVELNRHLFWEKWSKELAYQMPKSPEAVERASQRQRRRAFVVDHYVPRFDEDAGSVRMFAILVQLRRLGYAVTFLPDNRIASEPYTSVLQGAGIEVLYGDFDLGLYLSDIAAGLDLVLLSRVEVAWKYTPMLRERAPLAKLLFDTVDLHFLREGRRAVVENDPTVTRRAEIYQGLELGLARAADATLVASPFESDLLSQVMPDRPVFVVPTIHESVPEGPGFSHRLGLLFVGGFVHHPNGDAVVWFVREVMPRLTRILPQVTLQIVGSHPTAEVLALADDNVEVLGWVPDLRPLYEQARVSVAPLRYGAGIKGKISEALSHGIPVVTTNVGAEGLGLRHDRDILIADDAESFALEVARLYTDRALWQALAVAGRARVAEQYSPEVVREEIRRMFGELGLAEVPPVTAVYASGQESERGCAKRDLDSPRR